MHKTPQRIVIIAGASMLALASMAAAQNQPAGTMTPPGEQMPAETPTEPTPPAMPSPGETTTSPPETPTATPAPSDRIPVATDTALTVTANVVAANSLSTLERAVVAAGLAEALGGAGPFTVFAPDDAAFGLVRPDALTALMEPANRVQLENILKAHVVAGRVTAADLLQQIQAGGGSATLETIGGDRLTATQEGAAVVITGANNSRVYVTQADANASNGVIHIVNGVLLPAD